MKKINLSIAVVFTILIASDQIPAPAQNAPLLLKNGIVHPVSQPSFEGDVLFDNGLITQMGKGITAPPDAEVLDLSGMHIYPGLIAA
ncbi:MAG: amidohydrolase, partial [Fidelibacterota bacterium]